MDMKLGIAGAGMIVNEFLPLLKQIDGLELAAIWNRSREKAAALAAAFGIPLVTATYEELLASGIDTVYLGLPNDLHACFAIRAMEAGVNAIVEKPLAANLREAEQLAAVSGKTGCFVFEALSTPYLDSIPVLQSWLPELGTLKLAESRFTQFSSRYRRFQAGELAPAFDPNHAGGALMDLGVYTLSLLTTLLGEPSGFQYHANPERGVDTSGILTLQYPGTQAACVFAKDCGSPPLALLEGTEGTIRIDGHPGRIERLTMIRRDGSEERFTDLSFPTLPHFRAALRAWEAQDKAFFARRLDASLQISRLLTEARRQAGICFPCDR